MERNPEIGARTIHRKNTCAKGGTGAGLRRGLQEPDYPSLALLLPDQCFFYAQRTHTCGDLTAVRVDLHHHRKLCHAVCTRSQSLNEK